MIAASDAFEWPAPAKLNLFLHITGRRADGYHLLQTVFQLLDYGDSLRFALREDGAIDRISELPGVPCDVDLVVRAARLLQEACGCRLGADIELVKRLPLGGGLGGGSSDAATTLVALNRLWACGLRFEELAALGVQLGADVPVFVHGRSAWAEGIGERLSPIELPSRWFVVIKPPVEVSTAALFSAPELTRNCTPLTISAFSLGAGVNVFESLVRTRYPLVGEALDWLDRQGACYDATARLTGTGSCVFAVVSDRRQAQDVLDRVPTQWQSFVAKGVNRSPLHDKLFANKGA